MSDLTLDKYDVAEAIADGLGNVALPGIGTVLAGVDSEDWADVIVETVTGQDFRLRVTQIRKRGREVTRTSAEAIDLDAACAAIDALDWGPRGVIDYALPESREILDAALPLILAQVIDPQTGWTGYEWAEWSNKLADLMPEEYDGDEAQESLVERFVRDSAEAHVKPSREDVARAIYESQPRNVSWEEQNPRYCALFRREADAVLILLPGRSEQEVLPLPAVHHKGPHDTDASMLSAAADRLERGYPLGGSNVTDAVVRLIRSAVILARGGDGR